MVRTGLIALALAVAVVGCKGKSSSKATPKKVDKVAEPAPPEPRIPEGPVPVTLPKIDAKVARRVQAATAFVTIDKNGAMTLGQLATGPTPYAGRPRGPGPLEDDLFAAQPAAGAGAGSGAAAGSAVAADDPPPPDDPASGQYKMKKPDPDDDQQLARQQAIDAARKAGVLGSAATTQGGAFASLTGTGDISAGYDDANIYGGLLGNEAGEMNGGFGFAAGPPIKVRGTFEATGAIEVLILADAAAPSALAVQAIGALDRKRTAIAVDGGAAPDAIQFRFGAAAATAEPPTSTTIYVTPGEGVYLAQEATGRSTMVPLLGGAIDRDKVVAALRPSPLTPVTGTVAVVLDATTPVQTLVEVLGALASAGAIDVRVEAPSGGGGSGYGMIGTGSGTGYGIGGSGGGMAGRTSSVPQVRIGQPSSVGDLDKAIIRRYIKRNIAKLTYCYEKQLLATPGLEGTVSAQFFISPSGHVSSSTATGVDPAVADCVAIVIEGIEFPKPKGGGGVQVNYPFTFKPAGG